MLFDPGSRYALVISLLAHATLLAATTVVAARELDEPSQGDDWATAPLGGGDTFEIDGLVEGDEGDGDGDDGREPVDEADDAPAEAAPSPQPTTPPEPTPAPEVPAPKPPAPEPPAAEPPADEPQATPPATAPQSSASAMPGRQAKPAPAGEGSNPGKGRRWGAAGARRGVANIARDFARALPAAASGDPGWSRNDLGEVGRVDASLRLDARGRISNYAVPSETPMLLRRMVQRTVALLHAGRFALSAAPGQPGREVLRIEVTLSQHAPIDREGVKPEDALKLGHEPPTRDAPGKAFFTLASGRHVEAIITILSSRADEGTAEAEASGGGAASPSGSDGGSPPAASQ